MGKVTNVNNKSKLKRDGWSENIDVTIHDYVSYFLLYRVK